MKLLASFLFTVIVGGSIMFGLQKLMAEREFIILITLNPPPAQIIGRIQSGLPKADAERAAAQLNELFSKEKLEWRAVTAEK